MSKIRVIVGATGELRYLGGGTTELVKVLENLVKFHQCDVELVVVLSKGQQTVLPKDLESYIKIEKAPSWTSSSSFLNRMYEQIILPFKLLSIYLKSRFDLYLGLFSYVPLVWFVTPKVSFFQINVLGSGVDITNSSLRVKYFLRKQLTYLSLRASSAIAFISNFHRLEIEHKFAFDRRKSFVVHLGAEVPSNEELSRLFGKVNDERLLGLLERRYIIYPSVFRPYKNHQLLIDAFIELRKDERFSDILLALTGDYNTSWGKAIRSACLDKDGIVFLGNLRHYELLYLLRKSQAMVFPSRWEGFGLPPIEAMAAGVPVICSNGGSLPEVAGDAALMFDKNSREELVKALKLVLGDQDVRRILIEKGFERARKFTWQATVDSLVEVFKKAVQ